MICERKKRACAGWKLGIVCKAHVVRRGGGGLAMNVCSAAARGAGLRWCGLGSAERFLWFICWKKEESSQGCPLPAEQAQLAHSAREDGVGCETTQRSFVRTPPSAPQTSLRLQPSLSPRQLARQTRAAMVVYSFYIFDRHSESPMPSCLAAYRV